MFLRGNRPFRPENEVYYPPLPIPTLRHYSSPSPNYSCPSEEEEDWDEVGDLEEVMVAVWRLKWQMR